MYEESLNRAIRNLVAMFENLTSSKGSFKYESKCSECHGTGKSRSVFAHDEFTGEELSDIQPIPLGIKKKEHPLFDQKDCKKCEASGRLEIEIETIVNVKRTAIKKIAVIAFMLLNYFGYSQCTKICGTVTAISSGSSSVTGSVVVTNTVPVTVTNTVTVQQKAGTTLTVNPITGTVSLTGTPTVAITGTVPVSGTVTVANSVSTLTTNVTVATSVVTSNGSTSPNTFQISFLTSDDFTGSINGATVGGNVSITMPLINYRTYPSISYTRTTGSIIINEIR